MKNSATKNQDPRSRKLEAIRVALRGDQTSTDGAGRFSGGAGRFLEGASKASEGTGKASECVGVTQRNLEGLWPEI